jgi:hypothetical protein
MLATGFSPISAVAFGTSGMPTGSTPILQLSIGSSLNTLQKNDILFINTSGANAAGTYILEVVTQNLADYRSTYGF